MVGDQRSSLGGAYEDATAACIAQVALLSSVKKTPRQNFGEVFLYVQRLKSHKSDKIRWHTVNSIGIVLIGGYMKARLLGFLIVLFSIVLPRLVEVNVKVDLTVVVGSNGEITVSKPFDISEFSVSMPEFVTNLWAPKTSVPAQEVAQMQVQSFTRSAVVVEPMVVDASPGVFEVTAPVNQQLIEIPQKVTGELNTNGWGFLWYRLTHY